jgi:hypothetical protein
LKLVDSSYLSHLLSSFSIEETTFQHVETRVPVCSLLFKINDLGFCWLNSLCFLASILLLKLTDLCTIRVIPLYRKADEWPIWSGKFLAKAKRYGFKDLLLEKLSILKIDEIFDDVSEEGKKI